MVRFLHSLIYKALLKIRTKFIFFVWSWSFGFKLHIFKYPTWAKLNIKIGLHTHHPLTNRPQTFDQFLAQFSLIKLNTIASNLVGHTTQTWKKWKTFARSVFTRVSFRQFIQNILWWIKIKWKYFCVIDLIFN